MDLSKDLFRHCQPLNLVPLQLREQLTEQVYGNAFSVTKKASSGSEQYQSVHSLFKLFGKQKVLDFFSFCGTLKSLSTNYIYLKSTAGLCFNLN